MQAPTSHERVSRRRRIADAYRRAVEPAATGLPNWRVVVWFPALVTLGAIALIVLQISGTSSGSHFLNFGTGDDPQMLLGGPRPIRWDEWLVQQGWIVSQFQQGFPAINHTFPGGMDATVLNELPTWDWSTFFRPHMWGYLLFGLNVGAAWQWWIPAIGLVSGAYLLTVTLMPRRAITAAVIACVVFFTPIFQWWYGPNALWPAAWSLLAMAGTIWMLRDRRRWVGITWGAVLGWLAVTIAIGLYVPFIVSSLIVFVFFFLGSVAQERPWSRAGFASLARRLSPMIVAGAASVTVAVVFIMTRIDTVVAIQSTVYPGQRSEPAGQLLTQDPTFAGIAGAPWGQSFQSVGEPTILGPNPSEAATAILLAVFLAPALVWMVVRAYRETKQIDWVITSSLICLAVILVFLVVPGWDPIARLLFLDRVPSGRFRMSFAVMLPLFFALVARSADSIAPKRNLPLAVLSAAVALTVTVGVAIPIISTDPLLLSDGNYLWPLVAVAIIAATFLVFFRRGVPYAAGALLIAALIIAAPVNPFYKGIYNLNDTQIGKRIAAVEAADPGTWVGLGDYETMALVMEAGVAGYSGVQPYPSTTMWAQIDPTGAQSGAWNRLAHVRWTWGSGEPVVTAPQRDAIVSTFDACSTFAQTYVEYVVTDERPLSMDCLKVLADEEQGEMDMQIYEITKP